MSLDSTSAFASFDATAQSQILDISPVLEAALFYDLEFLGSLNMDFGAPIHDRVHYWNEDALNSDSSTVAASYTSAATTLTVASGTVFTKGDLLYVSGIAGGTEVMQVTAISTNDLTVTRGYNSTTAASIAAGATIVRIPAAQEASDFSSDHSKAVTVRSNYSQIMFGGDLQISRNQLDRAMAAIPDELAHQLHNRALELKRMMTRAFLYGEKSAAASDSVYGTLQGLRSAFKASGVTNTSDEALTWAILNSAANKPLVDLGLYPDTLVCGTAVAEQIATFDSTLRRMLETETAVGYTVNQIRLAQGNVVNVVVDGRVEVGDVFVYKNSKIRALPFVNAGMFVIAATDFTDGKKRRIGCEWTLEFRNPEAGAYLSAKD